MNQTDNSHSTATLSLSYEGEDVADNTIDVLELSDSLQAIHSLFIRSNQIINGRNAEASLRIQATPPGSFDISLLLLVTAYGVNLLPGDFFTAAANLKQLLTGNANLLGVFGAFKRLRGRPFHTTEQAQDTVTVTARDLQVSIPLKVFEIFQDSSVQRALHAIARPLRSDGINRIAIKDETGELISLDPDDVDFPEDYDSEEVIDNVIDIPKQNLTVVAPNLDDVYAKWRLNNGQTTNWYSIRDDLFLDRASQGDVKFGTGDILACSVRINQAISGVNKITNDYQVTRVIAHHGREVQHPLL